MYLKDSSSKLCHHTHKITGNLESLADGSTSDIALESYTGAISTLSYKPTQRGRHQLTVSVNDEAIARSPFHLYVQHPPAQLGLPVRIIRGLKFVKRLTVQSDRWFLTEGEKILVGNIRGRLLKEISSLEDGQRRVKIGPTGIAVNNDGVMFVADCLSHRLLKVSSDGKLLKAVGGRGECPGQFDFPDGVTLNCNKVYVCDTNNHRVQIFDTDLNLLGSFGNIGSGKGEFIFPYDLASDEVGCIFVADHNNHRVQVFSEEGTFRGVFAKRGGGPGDLDHPVGIHVHGRHVYITENGNKRVSVFNTSGEFVSSFVVAQVWLFGLAVDCDGFVYVCGNDHVCVY